MDFNTFYNSYKERCELNSAQLKDIVATWKKFREKILQEGLTPEEYNGKNEFFDNGECSLRQFIEHTCARDYFGTLGTVRSSDLGLWATGSIDNKIYRFNYRVTKKDFSLDEIEQYTKQTNEFLKELVTKYNWDELLDFLRKNPTFDVITYPSFVFGLVFLNSILKDEDLTDDEKKQEKHYDYQYGLVWIYKYDAIEKNKEFKKQIGKTSDANNKLTSFVKSKALCERCKELCKIDSSEMDADKVVLFEKTVWDFTHDISKMERGIIEVIDSNNKQIILTGAPGTGKTYAAQKIAMADDNAAVISSGTDKNGNTVDVKYQFVQFHPSFDYSDFVEGLRPVNIKGNTTFVRMDGIFKEFCRKAAYDFEKAKSEDEDYVTRYYFIIDEINRADLSKVFGELMYCFEYRGNTGKVKTQYSNLDTYVVTKHGPMTFSEIKSFNAGKEKEDEKIDTSLFGDEDLFADGFYIPENVYIIGTMNDIDRSVESFDFALRRRFKWYEVKASDVMDDVLPKIVNNQNAYDFVKDKIKALNEFISDSEENGMGLSDAYNIGPAYFKSYGESAGIYKTRLANVYRNEIEATLREYVRGRDQNSINVFLEECRNKFGLGNDYKWKKESDNEEAKQVSSATVAASDQEQHE